MNVFLIFLDRFKLRTEEGFLVFSSKLNILKAFKAAESNGEFCNLGTSGIEQMVSSYFCICRRGQVKSKSATVKMSVLDSYRSLPHSCARTRSIRKSTNTCQELS